MLHRLVPSSPVPRHWFFCSSDLFVLKTDQVCQAQTFHLWMLCVNVFDFSLHSVSCMGCLNQVSCVAVFFPRAVLCSGSWLWQLHILLLPGNSSGVQQHGKGKGKNICLEWLCQIEEEENLCYSWTNAVTSDLEMRTINHYDKVSILRRFLLLKPKGWLE